MLSKVSGDINTKIENQDLAIEEKLKLYKKMIFDLETRIRVKVDVSAFNKMLAEQNQSKNAFD